MGANPMGTCPVCGTTMYADVNGDPLCQKCLAKEREPGQKMMDDIIARNMAKIDKKKDK